MQISVASIRWVKFLQLVAIAAAFLVVLAHVYIAYFSFAQSDEFTRAKHAIEEGAFAHLRALHYGWGGRFSSHGVMIAVGVSPFFPLYTNVFTFLLVGMFFLSFWLVCTRLNNQRKVFAYYDLLFVALLLPTEVRNQGFYWQNGNFTYVFPCSLFLLAMLFVTRNFGIRGNILVAILFAFLGAILGGFNELLPVILLIGIVSYLFVRQHDLHHPVDLRLTLLFAGLVMGYAFALFAPGNYNRRSVSTNGVNDWAQLFSITFDTAMHRTLPFFATVLAYGFLRARYCPYSFNPCRTWFDATRFFMAAFAAVGVCFFGVVWGYKGAGFAGPTEFAPYVFLCLTVPVLMSSMKIFFAGKKTSAKSINLLIALTCMVFLSVSAWKNSVELFQAVLRAPQQQEMSRMQMKLAFEARQQKQKELVVPVINEPGKMPSVHPLSKEPSWINNTFATFFDLEKLSAQ